MTKCCMDTQNEISQNNSSVLLVNLFHPRTARFSQWTGVAIAGQDLMLSTFAEINKQYSI